MMQNAARTLGSLMGFLILLYLCLLLFLFLIQSRLLYFPAREMVFTPADRGLKYKRINLKASDGMRIAAWHINPGPDKTVILLCNGNGGNMSYAIQLVEMLAEMKFAVFTFDYRGYGESTGNPDEKGTYRDVRAAWDYLTGPGGYTPYRIVLFGHSLGGGVCSHLALEKRAAALILQNAFTSVPDLAQELYPYFPARYLVRNRYPVRENLRAIHLPLLILHSRDDEIIPLHHGRENFAAANEPKVFVELRGGHNTAFLYSEAEFHRSVGEFLRRHLGGP